MANENNTVKASQEEINAALELMRKTKERQAKQREKAKANPESKVKQAAAAAKRRVRDTLLVKKAIAAGIVVTEQEINDYIKASKA